MAKQTTLFSGRRKAKQEWHPGAWVTVGFMACQVIKKIPTPGDWAPDQWLLIGANGKEYTFTPHRGLAAGWPEAR